MEVSRGLHLFSRFAYLYWVAAYFTGAILVMASRSGAHRVVDSRAPSASAVCPPRQHGRWPDTLEQLVPEFLPSVPLDPEDGAPLRFHKRTDRVVVYSAMKKQGAVDGPEFYDPDEPSPPGVGIAVHLFDVKFRRQPPRPKPATSDDDPQ